MKFCIFILLLVLFNHKGESQKLEVSRKGVIEFNNEKVYDINRKSYTNMNELFVIDSKTLDTSIKVNIQSFGGQGVVFFNFKGKEKIVQADEKEVMKGQLYKALGKFLIKSGIIDNSSGKITDESYDQFAKKYTEDYYSAMMESKQKFQANIDAEVNRRKEKIKLVQPKVNDAGIVTDNKGSVLYRIEVADHSVSIITMNIYKQNTGTLIAKSVDALTIVMLEFADASKHDFSFDKSILKKDSDKVSRQKKLQEIAEYLVAGDY
jgi:hypothetical protein